MHDIFESLLHAKLDFICEIKSLNSWSIFIFLFAIFQSSTKDQYDWTWVKNCWKENPSMAYYPNGRLMHGITASHLACTSKMIGNITCFGPCQSMQRHLILMSRCLSFEWLIVLPVAFIILHMRRVILCKTSIGIICTLEQIKHHKRNGKQMKTESANSPLFSVKSNKFCDKWIEFLSFFQIKIFSAEQIILEDEFFSLNLQTVVVGTLFQ